MMPAAEKNASRKRRERREKEGGEAVGSCSRGKRQNRRPVAVLPPSPNWLRSVIGANPTPVNATSITGALGIHAFILLLCLRGRYSLPTALLGFGRRTRSNFSSVV
ncbi:hypothetical protein L211DRAFT_837572 [Terfezia boudieri ATCC MYA-4762]|uniref:Uncharacterized protein n=1 Tax=Terfezia boudieri ATCC MYA-4762 TaxID=1051890 RepID=A0A3N4LP96_9PEZI|nr:hypothetical protein L211DRAFT_837572 [Terfezia boudieri ATCC MYA-4762]